MKRKWNGKRGWQKCKKKTKSKAKWRGVELIWKRIYWLDIKTLQEHQILCMYTFWLPADEKSKINRIHLFYSIKTCLKSNYKHIGELFTSYSVCVCMCVLIFHISIDLNQINCQILSEHTYTQRKRNGRSISFVFNLQKSLNIWMDKCTSIIYDLKKDLTLI